MTTLYKISEWQGASNFWYVNSVQDFNSIVSEWWFPSRVWNLTLSNFAILLKDTYHAIVKISYNKFLNEDILSFYWSNDNYKWCHKFILDTNKKARERKIMI